MRKSPCATAIIVRIFAKLSYSKVLFYGIMFSMERRKPGFCLLLCCVLAFLPLLTACGSVVVNADAQPAALYINEVMSSNAHTLTDEALGTPDWIEIYNASSQSVSLEGYGLSDNLKEPMKWRFPAVSIGPGEYLLLYACDAAGELCTGFGLSKNGETLYFSDAYYNMLQILEIPALQTDISYARDAENLFGYCAAPTPGYANGVDIVSDMQDIQYAGSGALRIAEVLPKNRSCAASGDGRFYPYVKLYNSAASPISLSGFALSDDAANPLKWQMPDVSLAPGGYALVYLSGRDEKSGELHSSFKLGSADDSLYLSDTHGQICESLHWELGLPEGIAVIADNTYTAFPMPFGDNDTRSFTNAAFVEADASEPLRLNEVLVENEYSIRDETGRRSPWLELYNSAQEPFPLGGYYISDDPDNPLKWALPPERTIEPGAYLLVYLDGADSGGETLHASFNLSQNDPAVLLTNKNGLKTQTIPLDPPLGGNVSAGMGGDGQLAYFTSPTPGAPNDTHAFSGPEGLTLTDMGGVYISEVCAVNPAKSGDADWVELHNASSRNVNLAGWQLSDDPDEPARFVFPDFEIEAGAYRTLKAIGAAAAESTGLPFGIAASGETLFLWDGEGALRDVFDTGALRSGVSAGRTKENPARVFFTSLTPGKTNAAPAAQSYVAAPLFSQGGLYQKEAFTLSLTSPTEDASLYYTLDGSKPSAASTLYTGPLQIEKNTVVKAIACKEGMLESDIVAATYLFEDAHTLPVVCLSTDSLSFEEVYSVTDRWEKVEREAYCEYFERDGKLGVRFPCGIRVNGASTLLARQKSLSIFLRGGYGVSGTNYPFFPESDVKVYHSLSVRNSGQDRDKARMRDSLFAMAAKGLHIETVETKPVIVYINAQYWGIYDLNENQNEAYMQTHYGVDPDAVDIIRRNETRLAGERADMKRVREYAVRTDLSDDEKFREFSQWVDVDYFTDYIIAQSYFANGDMFNQKYWRSQDYTVKWRPLFYDLDLGFSSSNPSRNILPNYFKPEGVPSQDGSLTNMDIFCGLRKNATWCDAFCERYVYVAYNHLTPERLTGLLDAYAAQLEPEMERHIERWDDPNSISVWKNNVESLRRCLLERRDYALKALQKEFNISDAQMQAYTEAAKAGAAQGQNALS